MSDPTSDISALPMKSNTEDDPIQQEIAQLTQEGLQIVEAGKGGKSLVEAVEKLGEASRLL